MLKLLLQVASRSYLNSYRLVTLSYDKATTSYSEYYATSLGLSKWIAPQGWLCYNHNGPGSNLALNIIWYFKILNVMVVSRSYTRFYKSITLSLHDRWKMGSSHFAALDWKIEGYIHWSYLNLKQNIIFLQYCKTKFNWKIMLRELLSILSRSLLTIIDGSCVITYKLLLQNQVINILMTMWCLQFGSYITPN